MNQLNKILADNQEMHKKLFMFCMEERLMETAPLEEVVSILKDKGFGAVCLICTGTILNCMEISKKLTGQLEMPVVLETDFHKVFTFGISEFAKAAADTGISGIRIPNLPFEEQGQMAVHLLEEEGPFLIREITPASGDRIVQNMQFARGFIWCGSEGNTEFLSGLQGDPLVFYLYAVEAAATRPVLLDFDSRYLGNLENYLDSADGAILGKELRDIFRREGYSAQKLKDYCSRLEILKSE